MQNNYVYDDKEEEEEEEEEEKEVFPYWKEVGFLSISEK